MEKESVGLYETVSTPPTTDISRLKMLKGLALQDIITQIHTYIHRGQLYILCGDFFTFWKNNFIDGAQFSRFSQKMFYSL